MGKESPRIHLVCLAFFAIVALMHQHNLVDANKDHEDGGFFNSGGASYSMDAVSNAAVEAASFASERVGSMAATNRVQLTEVVDKAERK